jgi:hypothetical protein
MPMPDLSQPAGDAATLIAEVAAMSGPSAPNRAPGLAGFGQQQQLHAYQPRAKQQQQQQQVLQQQVLQQQVRAAQQRAKAQAAASTRRGKKRGWQAAASSDEEAPPTGALTAQERARWERRAGRFGDGAAEGGRPKGAPSAAARRARLVALLEAGGEGEEVDWDAFAIKASPGCSAVLFCFAC